MKTPIANARIRNQVPGTRYQEPGTGKSAVPGTRDPFSVSLFRGSQVQQERSDPMQLNH
jgi:hypothetical protein